MKSGLFFVLAPALMFLLPLHSGAQDCKLIRDTDPYTREVRLSSGFIVLTGAQLSIESDSKEIDYFITIPSKCFDDASTVWIFFAGNRVKTTYRNAGSRNCDGYFHFKYRNGATTNSVMQRLSTMKVEKMVFTGTDKKEVEVLFDEQEQLALMQATACMIAESKTLIKP